MPLSGLAPEDSTLPATRWVRYLRDAAVWILSTGFEGAALADFRVAVSLSMRGAELALGSRAVM